MMSCPAVFMKEEKLKEFVKYNYTEIKDKKITYSEFTLKLRGSEILGKKFPKEAKNRILVCLCEYYKEENDNNILMSDRIKIPVRSTNCTHADVFDFALYCGRTREWNFECPICHKEISFCSLYVDQRIAEIIERIESQEEKPIVLDVILNSDGTIKNMTEYTLDKMEEVFAKSQVKPPTETVLDNRGNNDYDAPSLFSAKEGVATKSYQLSKPTLDSKTNEPYFELSNTAALIETTDVAVICAPDFRIERSSVPSVLHGRRHVQRYH